MDNYIWTKHSLYKMKQYGLSQQRVIRIIRYPERIEEGIVPKTIAVMQPASVKTTAGKGKTWSQEIWAMYQLKKFKVKSSKLKVTDPNFPHPPTPSPLGRGRGEGKVKIISAWRYPGMSPKNNPIPEEILDEIRNLA